MEVGMEHYDLVEKALSELQNEKIIYPVPITDSDGEAKIERMKAMLTRRAAYYINQVDSTLGLLRKTSGNNIDGLSVDILLRKNGEYMDCNSDITLEGRRFVVPTNGEVKQGSPEGWVQPTKELAGLTNGVPPVEQPPSNTDDIQEKLDTLIDMESRLMNAIITTSSVLATVLSQDKEIIDRSIQIESKLNSLLNQPGLVLRGSVFGFTVTLTQVK